MKDSDLDYFSQKEIHRNEEFITAIECLHEGNPFVGTLILTNYRLAFVRKATPGFEIFSIKSGLIVKVEQRIDRGLDFILVVSLDKFSQEFELRGMDMAGKQAFVDQTKQQFGLLNPGYLAPDNDQPSNRL